MTLKQAIEQYILTNGFSSKVKERNIDIDDIENHIIEYARKTLDSKNGALSDKEVYGEVVHYIEDGYKSKEPKEKPQAQVKVKAVKTDTVEQLNLFDTL